MTTTTNGNHAVSVYGSQGDIDTLAGRIKTLLPGGKRYTNDEALMFAQFCHVNGLNPFNGEAWLPKNENTGEILGMLVGIKGLRRYSAHQMETISGNYWVTFRLITDKVERENLGILGNAIAYEARLFDTATLRDYATSWDTLKSKGVPNDIISTILGLQPYTTGLGVWKVGEQTKMQPAQCAQFRAEKDALKRRFYIPFGAVEQAEEYGEVIEGTSVVVDTEKRIEGPQWPAETAAESEAVHEHNQGALGRNEDTTGDAPFGQADEPRGDKRSDAKARIVKHSQRAKELVSQLSQAGDQENAAKLDAVIARARVIYGEANSTISLLHKCADELKAANASAEALLAQPA